MSSNVSEYLFTEVNVVKVCVKGFLRESENSHENS